MEIKLKFPVGFSRVKLRLCCDSIHAELQITVSLLPDETVKESEEPYQAALMDSGSLQSDCDAV